MGWFTKKISFLTKTSSKADVKAIALQKLDAGEQPWSVAFYFANAMFAEDRTFQAESLLGISNNPVALRNYIQSIDSGEQVPSPVIPEAPAAEAIPGVQTPEIENNMVSPDEVADEEVIEEEDNKTEEEDNSEEEDKDDDNPMGEEVDEDGIIGKEEVLTNQVESPPDFNDRVVADPTVLETFELPVEKIPTIRNKLAKINKKLRDLYYPEIKIEFVGEAYEKPVQYQNRIVKEPYIQVKISGTMPSPSEEIPVKVQERVKQRDGSYKMKTTGYEPKGVRLIAKVIHTELSEEEQQKYLSSLPANSPLRRIIEETKAKGEPIFFNVVEPLEGAPPIQGKFYYSSPQFCRACLSKKAGHSARKSTYIGVVVPPEQMVDKKAMITQPDGSKREVTLTRRIKNKTTGQIEDQPIKVIPDEVARNAHQDQFGGKCIDPFDAVKTITQLKNWVKTTKQAKEAYAQKKSKSKYKGGGWGTASVPTENLLATAVSILRNPAYRGMSKRLTGVLAARARAYTISLKEKENGVPTYNYRLRSQTPRIVEEDKQIAADVAKWWRERLGALDLEGRDKNKISLSVVSSIGTSTPNLRDVIEMVETYLIKNNITLEQFPSNTQAPATEAPSVTEPEKEPEQEKVQEQEEIMEPEITPSKIVNINDVKTGDHFISKFKYQKSGEWRTGLGVSHYFTDNNGNKYVVFDRYKKDPVTKRLVKEPSMSFDANQEYYLEGDKGDTNTTYRTTTLNNVVPVDPDDIDNQDNQEAIPEEQNQTGLPSWYGKYDLGELVEKRLEEGSDPDDVVSRFLKSMAMISPTFKDEKTYQSYENMMKRMWRNEAMGGKPGLIRMVKNIYRQFGPK